MAFSEKAADRILNLILYPIIFMPIWWLTGLKFIIFHIFVLIAFLSIAIKFKGKLRFSLTHTLLLMYVLIYFFSLIVHSQEYDFFRVLGSLYNLSFWIIGLMTLIIIQNLNINNNRWIYLANILRKLGCKVGILSTFAIILWYLFGYKSIQFNTLLGSFIPTGNSLLLEHSFVANLVSEDWIFGNAVPRITGFFAYPTAMSISISVVMFFSIFFYKFNGCKTSRFRIVFELLIMIMALLFSASRSVFVGIITALVVVTTLNISGEKKRMISEILLRILLVLLISIILYFTFFDLLQLVLTSREGSTIFRINLYIETIKEAVKNPIIGIGVKITNDKFYAPVGSHSTYIGSLLKTGIMGTLFLLLFKVSVLRKWITTKKYLTDPFAKSIWLVLGSSFFVYSFWMLTDDIDAPIIASFIYFLIVGLILNLYTSLKKRAENE